MCSKGYLAPLKGDAIGRIMTRAAPPEASCPYVVGQLIKWTDGRLLIRIGSFSSGHIAILAALGGVDKTSTPPNTRLTRRIYDVYKEDCRTKDKQSDKRSRRQRHQRCLTKRVAELAGRTRFWTYRDTASAGS